MAVASTRSQGSIHLTLAVLAVAVIAWISVIVLHSQLMVGLQNERLAEIPAEIRRFLRYCGNAPDMTGPGFGNWMLGWFMMVMAMMLPPALPLLRAAERLLDNADRRVSLILLMAASFLAVWIAAGLLLFVGGSGLRAGLSLLPDNWASRTDIAAGMAAIAVGAFQFTPLKMACMDACRSPTAVMMVEWRESHPARSAIRVGSRYGMICVGCCWAMMTLALLVGALMLPIMVACALLMTLERLLPVFRPLVPLQAGLAVGIGILLLAGSISPAFF